MSFASRVLSPICFGGLLISSTLSHAIPTLQLDTEPGTYDPVTQTTIATSNPFTLRALIDASSIDINRNFYISAAILPNPGATPSPDFGSFTINGTSFNSGSGMQYGIPPVDAAIGNLPTHSVFPTWYAELQFSAVGSPTLAAYNVQDGSSGPGLLHYVDFTINISGLYSWDGLTSPYAVHFDLYTYDLVGDPKKLKVDAFAPFSHDAESGHGITVGGGNPTPVPEGGSMVAFLGCALMGLGGLRRKLA